MKNKFKKEQNLNSVRKLFCFLIYVFSNLTLLLLCSKDNLKALYVADQIRRYIDKKPLASLEPFLMVDMNLVEIKSLSK